MTRTGFRTGFTGTRTVFVVEEVLVGSDSFLEAGAGVNLVSPELVWTWG